MGNDENIAKIFRKTPEKLFSESLEKRLTVITAPSGYGKTTVVKDYFQRNKDMKSFWLRMGTGESDENWLWQKLCKQFAIVDAELASQFCKLSFPYSQQEADEINILLKSRLTREICLVIDNYQECKSSEFDKLISRIVFSDITNLHIVIISRVIPDFPFEEMITKQVCTHLDYRVFTLSEQETREMLECNSVNLSPEKLEKILEYTDGWIAAVYLVIIEYKRNNDFKLSMNMLQLLRKTIFETMSEEARNLVMCMSVFDSLHVEEACYIAKLDNQDTLYLLTEILNMGFIYINNETQEISVHTLLHLVAFEELKKSGIQKEKLFLRAGDWRMKKGDLIVALMYYEKAGLYETVFELLEKNKDAGVYDKASVFFETFFQKSSLELRMKYTDVYFSFIYAKIVN